MASSSVVFPAPRMDTMREHTALHEMRVLVCLVCLVCLLSLVGFVLVRVKPPGALAYRPGYIIMRIIV
jgi:hypothetical protein